MEERNIIITHQSGVINTNFTELKENISAQMEVYKELEVTEANRAERKKDIATLRKYQKALTEEKTKVKNEFMKPYYDFESLVKELQSLYEEPINLLDNQVKEFEEKQRLEKIAYIKELFEEVAADISENVSLNRIYNQKWENSTVSRKNIKEEITSKVAEIKQAIATISSMISDKSQVALDMYYTSLDLATSINFINRYEAQKREWELKEAEKRRVEQEQALQREIERVRRETIEQVKREQEIIVAAQVVAVEQVHKEIEQEKQAMAVQKQESDVKYATYTFEATEEEIKQIEMYLNSLGVEFERVI